MNTYMNGSANGSNVVNQEYEWELQEAAHYSQSQMEGEWESQNEYFLSNILPSIQRVARASVPIAKQLAPIAAKTLIGKIPNSAISNLLNSLLQQGESSAVAMEAQFFGTNAAEAEVSNGEVSYEAALAEVLAAEASHSKSISEAGAFLGAAVPSIVDSMGGSRVLRPIMPTLVQANAPLVHLLHQKGPVGRRLLRLAPNILRRTIASLQSAHQTGHPINSSLALRLMAEQASRVLGNSQTVTNGIIRNAVIQKRTTR
ncbi:MAG: hypothetical protein KAF91_31840 [Nostoc sp. TH1S01]|nr:hypothetical protein [Nostoc sp. TH1S01]